MKFIVMFLTLAFTNCAQDKQASRAKSPNHSDSEKQKNNEKVAKTSSAKDRVFDGDIKEVNRGLQTSPLVGVFGDDLEAVKTSNNQTLTSYQQIGVNPEGDLLLKSHPGEVSLGSFRQQTASSSFSLLEEEEPAPTITEMKKNSDGSSFAVIKDKKTGKTLATVRLDASGRTIITTHFDIKTQKPVQEETKNIDPKKKDKNNQPLLISRVNKIYYPNGTIQKVTIYGEDNKPDSIETYNQEGKKTQDEYLAEDGQFVAKRIIYLDDGTTQTKTFNPTDQQYTTTYKDADGNVVDETIDDSPEESPLTPQTQEYVNRIVHFQTTTWDAFDLLNYGERKEESKDNISISKKEPMLSYQENYIPNRNEDGTIVRDDDGIPVGGSYSSPAFCSLSVVLFNDVHGDTEKTSCDLGQYQATEKKDDRNEQNEYGNNHGMHFLEASKNNDSDAYCAGLCWQLETALKPFQADTTVSGSQIEKLIDDPDKKSFCFLKKVEFTNLDQPDGPGSCRVYRKDNAWFLESKVAKNAKAFCEASCLNIGENYVAVEEETLSVGAAMKEAKNYQKFMTEQTLESFKTSGTIKVTSSQESKIYKEDLKEGTSLLSTVCGLTGVMMGDLDDGKEHFQCHLTGDAGNHKLEKGEKFNDRPTLYKVLGTQASMGADELDKLNVRWTLYASGTSYLETATPIEDGFGECQAVCFQIKHDCDNNGEADLDIYEVCPLKEVIVEEDIIPVE